MTKLLDELKADDDGIVEDYAYTSFNMHSLFYNNFVLSSNYVDRRVNIITVEKNLIEVATDKYLEITEKWVPPQLKRTYKDKEIF